MTSLSVSNLIKDWGAFRAVDDISFQAHEAEFIALLGPSGCGKSTTLRLVAGLDTVSSGSIAIGGREVSHLAPAKRNLSMVFQSYALFPHLTAAENILFGLLVRGVPKNDQRKRLRATAELLGLEELLDRRPNQMSGGQQQRVALGRALISETPVCLLDEPLSNLDAKLRAGMRSEIRALQKRLGITMIYVTHDQTEAMTMADKVILMNKGRIEQAATPAELYEKPASAFVAQFIGTPPMNILDLEQRPQGYVIAGGERPVVHARIYNLQVGIRPEHFRIVEKGERATVRFSEYLGAETVLACTLGHQNLQVRLPGRTNFADGMTVELDWDTEAMHFFETPTGLRRDDVKALVKHT